MLLLRGSHDPDKFQYIQLKMEYGPQILIARGFFGDESIGKSSPGGDDIISKRSCGFLKN